MTLNFIKKIIDNKVDHDAHRKFTRYSLGRFQKEELKIKFGKKIQLWGGLEYLDTFQRIVAEVNNNDIELNGMIITSKDIDSDIAYFGIEPSEIKKARGSKKYIFKATLTADKFKEFADRFKETYMMVNLKGKDVELKTKKALPKIGKPVEKFVTIKLPADAESLIRDEFCFGSNDNEISIINTYFVDKVEIPKEFESDPLKARLEAKRVGKLVMSINGKEKEYKINV